MTLNNSDDIDRIMTIMAVAFDPSYGEAWSRRQVEDALLIGNCSYLLIGADQNEPGTGEEAAGFSLIREGFDEEELLLFAVAPRHRGRGLGRTMLDRLASDARSRGAQRLLLEMREGNPAGTLYARYGFTQIGRRPNYYRSSQGNRIAAITFAKLL